MAALLERDFQGKLIAEIKRRFPGCIVMKSDANYIQGIPDLLVLYGRHWAALECKRSANAPVRPNQDYYITEMSQMSFASLISPETREEVLYALEQSFRN